MASATRKTASKSKNKTTKVTATKGVRIPRLFTEAGRDPFTGVEFTYIYSSVRNIDGSVISEMNDVEVPASWDQTAVDILVSKYFRKAGVPQVDKTGQMMLGDDGQPLLGPETSAKQWAMRLANAWRIWGERAGYFATKADAEAYRDEMAYMLITQMASPNSPQHFNTGLYEAYDITADPEGNWYVDSVTGETKESTHRYERVAVNACFPAGTRVLTRSGGTPIEKIEPGTSVLTHEGRWQPVVATMQRQIDEDVHTFQLSRMTARPFTTTSEHPILAIPSNRARPACTQEMRDALQPDWILAKDLKVGDFVVMADVPEESTIPAPIDLADYCYGSPYFKVETDTILSTQGRRSFNRFLSFEDPNVMRLFGRWIGDGSFDTQKKTGALSHVRFTFDSHEEEAQADIGVLMEDLCGITANVELAKGQNTAHLRFGNRPLAEWMFETFGSGFATKSIPDFVDSMPRSHRVNFLAGLWGSDGCESRIGGRRYLHFDNSNLEVAETTWRLLRSLGAAPAQVGGRIPPGGTAPQYRTTVAFHDVPELATALDFEIMPRSIERGVRRLADGKIAYRVMSAKASHMFGTVYNFSVEEDETYVVENAVVHNCFISRVEDELVGPYSIFDYIQNEARLFKSGSGSGANLSFIRAKGERLSGGGTSSGVMSFARVADRAAGAIKSGGTTRRAAKMVILDVDHPEVEDFIWCKVNEEKKVAALVAGGYSSDWNGEAYDTVAFQNGNNSIRLLPGFMKAVKDDANWDLTARQDGSVMKTVRARELWDQIADAAWRCADPGVQFDDILNDWNTAANDERLRGTNPCFTADTLVHTDKGLVRFDELLTRHEKGETFGVYTHDATNESTPDEVAVCTIPETVRTTGINPVVRLSFSNGMEVRCTPNHKIWTTNRGYVEAQDISSDDEVKVLNVPTPATMASYGFGVSTDPSTYAQGLALSRTKTNLPEKWTDGFAHLLGWLTGDGCMAEDGSGVVLVYGSEVEQNSTLPVHHALLQEFAGRDLKVSDQTNGTKQLRISQAAFRGFLGALGVSSANGPKKRITSSILQTPTEIMASYLQGLFDADGCVVDDEVKGTRYVGLGSASPELLRDVQRALSTFGIHSRIYNTRKEGGTSDFSYVRINGDEVTYDSAPMWDLRITGRSIKDFHAKINFSISTKSDKLDHVVTAHRFYNKSETVHLTSRAEEGVERTYNLSEPRNHSYVANGVVVKNCSEYTHVDDTACNLASLNLVKYFDDHEQEFNIEAFTHAVRLLTLTLEISVSMSHYPSERIAARSFEHRTLGLGYANLGALLMRSGLPYDSPEGAAVTGAITALMHDTSYATSSELAAAVGACIAYERNKDPMHKVIRNHARAAFGSRNHESGLGDYEGLTVAPVGVNHKVLGRTPFAPLSDAVVGAAQDMLAGTTNGVGFRNMQTTVLAPTGCIVSTSLVSSSRGLVRLDELGDTEGSQWQDLQGVSVLTDEGAKEASKFYINGLSEVVKVQTDRGYTITGTPEHRVKVVSSDGSWQWRRFGEIKAGELVPLAMGQMVGSPVAVSLPPLPEMHWTADFGTKAPRTMTPQLAELLGYFMGNGSLHPKKVRFAVANEDMDLARHVASLGKELFNITAEVVPDEGCVSVEFVSVPLVTWWDACGFSRLAPNSDHKGKGYLPRVPSSVRHTNDPETYKAFLRGLFEADSTLSTEGVACLSSSTPAFLDEVRSLLLTLGYPTAHSMTQSGWGGQVGRLRMFGGTYSRRFAKEVGMLSERKQAILEAMSQGRVTKKDSIPVSLEILDRVAPSTHWAQGGVSALSSLRQKVLVARNRSNGMVPRPTVEALAELTGDRELQHLLTFFYDTVKEAGLTGEQQLTYDLSVPENVTYVANGFVSHNTIGLQMGCDTTGIEPDFALVKFKKLAGGGYMKIVNGSVRPALKAMGYDEAAVGRILTHALGTQTLDGPTAVNRASLLERGLPEAGVQRAEVQLKAVTELQMAFGAYFVGTDVLEGMGISQEEYSAPDFSLLTYLGYTHNEVVSSSDVICGHQTVEGAADLRAEHLPVFDTANKCGDGTRFIAWQGHVRALGAVAPHLSGSASKTINMPNEATLQDVKDAYEMSYSLGVKCNAIYRDGSKLSQVLSSQKAKAEEEEIVGDVQAALDMVAESVREILPGESPTSFYHGTTPPKFKLDNERLSRTWKFAVGTQEVFLTAGEYADGTLGEVWITLGNGKEGTLTSSILHSFAVSISMGLQYGVPLERFVEMYIWHTFAPNGIVTGHSALKFSTSIMDAIFKILAFHYLGREDLVHVKGVHPKRAVLVDAADVDARKVAASAPQTVLVAPEEVVPADVSEVDVAEEASAPGVTTAGRQVASGESCTHCGGQMVRSGTCSRCLNCGETSGCS